MLLSVIDVLAEGKLSVSLFFGVNYLFLTIETMKQSFYSKFLVFKNISVTVILKTYVGSIIQELLLAIS